jgi:hypothetical protein
MEINNEDKLGQIHIGKISVQYVKVTTRQRTDAFLARVSKFIIE